MFDWQEEYKHKTVSAEDAINVVKSGDYVVFGMGREPLSLGLALAARKEELSDVRVSLPFPGRDFGWYDPGWESSFSLELAAILPVASKMMEERRCDFIPGDYCMRHSWASDNVNIDVMLLEIAPPNEHGFCSLGGSVWHKKKQIDKAKVVLAEVNPATIKTYGNNFVHVSKIDYFVQHVPSGHFPGTTDVRGRKTRGPDEVEKRIAEHASTLIRDGDTMEIGGGAAAEFITSVGVLDDKKDLGIHSEVVSAGAIDLVRKGVVTGSRKTIHPDKVVCTAVGGAKEHLDFVNDNPAFELYEADYVLDPRIIAANDNMVAINAALTVDLTGQVNAESVGPVQISVTGGQLSFVVGALLSRGGRCIHVVRSTAKNGTISRIGPLLPHSIVTTPRVLVDYVVTEFGIASLRNKTQRQRALELISIAHPDFRAELKKEAQKLFWA